MSASLSGGLLEIAFHKIVGMFKNCEPLLAVEHSCTSCIQPQICKNKLPIKERAYI